MKKLIALLLALVMMTAVFAGCNKDEGKEAGAAAEPAKTPLAGTMEELVNQLIEKCPVEFMGGVMPVDLTDTSEDGLWAIKNYTGLESADDLNDIAVYESMMGSQAYSLVLVRVNEGVDAKAVAQTMSDNIDTQKWICVGADEKFVVGYCDVIMLIMLDSSLGLSAQSYVDAFQEICGGQVDFTI